MAIPTTAPTNRFDLDSFVLPPGLEASEPPEARGLERDQVRLMVSRVSTNAVCHEQFTSLPEYLDAGDVLVINTSGTMNAALSARREDGTLLELHLSTQLPGNLWTVEARLPRGGSTEPFFQLVSGETLLLPAGGSVNVLAPYDCGCGRSAPGPTRLWVSRLRHPGGLKSYLRRFGSPIRYGYVTREWPESYYQTVYATEIGSAEMPSAGRAFSSALLTRLISLGVQVVPLLLHTGVASPEAHEPPYEEYYRVPAPTALVVSAARAAGARIIAVGTTVVRALETVTDAGGASHPGEGWTCTVVTPERMVRSVDGLLTGLHEPRSSHLLMLEAIAGRDHLEITYAEALRGGYLWHEFGDMHLILP
jgi:S-adenosylmethionine:tRNA ribosyltransferase-isomerase